MKKRCVRIANRSETGEKKVKMGRVGLLPSVSHMRVKAHVRPVYVGPFPHTQSLKNKPTYVRTKLRTHESKLRT